MNGRPASLRLRAVLFAIITLTISLGLVGLALDTAFQRSSESDLRQQMQTWVYLALGATEVSADGSIDVAGDLGDPLLNQPGSGVYVHVHGARDHWSSPSSLGVNLPDSSRVRAGQEEFALPEAAGGHYSYHYGVAWELEDGSRLPFTVSIQVDDAQLQPQLDAFRAGLWRWLGATGAILLLAQWLFFSLSLRPLRQVAADVAEIESGRAESLRGPYPSELEPLTSNLDRLLKTEKANQDRYRNALDSLAHSLKTPLAVIRSGLGSGGRDMTAVEQATDDMHHLIATRLQRAAVSTRRTLAAPCAVAPVVARLEASMRKVHSQVLTKLDVSMEEGLEFYGEERDLMELVGNLLDNACKYGDGRVRLTAGSLGTGNSRPGLWLRVENGGETATPQALEAMLQRGVRGDERIEGHGLGLSIVSEVVKAYGGDLVFSNSELDGICVELRIPPA